MSEAETLFYIQDVRVFTGNAMTWWCPNGQGYTTHIDKAGKYTRAEARSRTSRATDLLWPVELIDKIWSHHVDFQHVSQLPVEGVPMSKVSE